MTVPRHRLVRAKTAPSQMGGIRRDTRKGDRRKGRAESLTLKKEGYSRPGQDKALDFLGRGIQALRESALGSWNFIEMKLKRPHKKPTVLEDINQAR